MRSPESIRNAILEEMRAMNDWVSVAAVIGVLGTSSFRARRSEVEEIIECINYFDDLHLRTSEDGFSVAAKPLPTSRIVDSVFDKPDPADRTARMMELLIDSYPAGGGTARSSGP